MIYRKTYPLGNDFRILQQKTSSIKNQNTIRKSQNNLAENMHVTSINTTLNNLDILLKLYPGSNESMNSSVIQTNDTSKLSEIEHLGSVNTGSELSNLNSNGVETTTKISYSTSIYLDIPEPNKTTMITKTQPRSTSQNNTDVIQNSLEVARIFKDVNERIRSSTNRIESTANHTFSSSESISNTKRLSSSRISNNTKRTKANTDIRKNAGMIVFFVFLILFSITAPLGKDRLIYYFRIPIDCRIFT